MDAAARQMGGPQPHDLGELRRQLVGETGTDLVGALADRYEEGVPTGERQVVWPAHGEAAAGEMQLGEGTADAGAMIGLDATWPHTVEEGDDRRRAAAQAAQRDAVAATQRRRASHAVDREML